MAEDGDHDALVVEFMQITACSSVSDAAQHLASCGWRLDGAVNLYFSSGGATSEAEAAVRAPIPARSETLYGPSFSGARLVPADGPTGWEADEVRDVSGGGGRRRRCPRHGREEGGTSGGGGTGSTDADADAAPPTKRRTLAELYRAPVELTYRGGFHDAKAHAAGLSRWLLVNVQASGEFASHEQNRDVWASELVAQAVRENFVLWQVDADARGHSGVGSNEGGKVCGYYNLPRHKLPAVLVVDPVTGQLMDKLHGATDPNDVVMTAVNFAERKPIMPVRAKNNNPAASAAPPNGKREPAVATASSTPSETAQSEQEQTTTVTKPAVSIVAAVTASIVDLIPGEKVCKLRVRLPDGRVVTKEFGAQREVAALFRFCRSVLVGEGGVEEQPFRLMRFTGGSSMEEIGDESVSFEDLGLHLSTISVVPG